MIKSERHIYADSNTRFIGRLVWDDAQTIPRPGLLVTPAFSGLGPLEIQWAEDLAREGYAVLAVDYYGEGKRVETADEAYALMGTLNNDRPELARRMALALNALKQQSMVDSDRVGAMGFCFGGKAVLDLARSGEALQAAVSLHGVYDPPEIRAPKMTAAVLILHGWDDPLADPNAFHSLAQELSETCEDWQALAFGHTGHAFTNPAAQTPEDGMAFSKLANDRSWRALIAFFDEKLRPVT